MLTSSKRDSQSTYTIAASTLGLILAITALINSVEAQSSDRNRPSILTQPDITGIVDQNNHSEYFYSFVVQPGEVVITLDVTPDKRNTLNYVGVDLFNINAKKLLSFDVGVISKSKRKIRRLQIKRHQTIIMRISRRNSKGSASYRLHVGGSVQLPKQSTTSIQLPIQGILHLEMDDGTVREINLSRVRKVTVKDLTPERV
ncbi:MAG: hypothetical protein QNJ63_09615 [Calothrix sp. MO_192.B10]|nr:hypothetical protein [Calothrix sp. MO_192.B10]